MTSMDTTDMLVDSSSTSGSGSASSCSYEFAPSCYKPKPINSKKPLPGSMHFSVMKHYKQGFETMNALRHKGQLCDVILRADSQQFRAHKVVLAAASPYFKAMFCNSLREADMRDISLQCIHANTLQSLIEFAYTSEIHVSELNVCSLLPAANMLHMIDVIDACCTFLEQQLDPCNCIGIAEFAHAHDCMDLREKARKYTLENFGEVSQNDEFLALASPQVKHIIQKDELNVRCESEVFLAAVRWVEHDPRTRANQLEELLCGVRCHFLTPSFLQQQINYCDVLRSMPPCRAYLARVHEDLIEHRKCPDKRRKPNAPPVIYTIGGYLRQSCLDKVECYNPASKEWFTLSDLPTPRSGVGVIVVHGLLYVLGGRTITTNSHEDQATVDCFDPFMNLWRSCAPMTTPRNRLGVSSIDGLIYAMGGCQNGTHHNSVER